jgi:acetyl-CoA acetyltransferase
VKASRTPVVAGVGETKLGRLDGHSSLELHAWAAREAVSDAGIVKADIDGVLTCGSFVDSYLAHSCALCEYLAIEPNYTATLQTSAASATSMVMEAAAIIEAGLAEVILVVTADNMLSGLSPTGDVSRDGAIKKMVSLAAHPDFELPYGPIIPALYAMLASRHMHEYGTTSTQLAKIAVNQRSNALLNPRATTSTPLTIEDVLESRYVASPLHLFDCSLVSDGGGAVIVTSLERARSMRKHPIRILGSGFGMGHEHLVRMPDFTTSIGAVNSGKLALGRAGVSHEDLDVLEIYDPFTIALLILLEDLGFCEKGEGGGLVDSGELAIGGKWPLNTHGGLLSYAHSGLSGGIIHPIEAVRQLRGEGGAAQVKDAEIAMVHGNGAILSSESTVILARV